MDEKKPEPLVAVVAEPAGFRDWKFSHNNCPELIITAIDTMKEAEVIAMGLARIGLTETTHPCRAWRA